METETVKYEYEFSLSPEPDDCPTCGEQGFKAALSEFESAYKAVSKAVRLRKRIARAGENLDTKLRCAGITKRLEEIERELRNELLAVRAR